MAGTSLLALIDDIASILDDVALMTKVAAKNTAGVLGDDLALNAQQVAGVNADRELPVVWAVAVGSVKNKLILVPLALAISTFLPPAVKILLMIGGAYLCFEGFEKIAHSFLHKADEGHEHDELIAALENPAVDMVAFEKEKVQGAIRTDFVLSAEIITIALGTVETEPFGIRLAVLGGVALLMTVGVYGLVAGIVKLDDAGLYLSKLTGGGGVKLLNVLGKGLLALAPALLKFLSVAGTIAMFMVGGSILAHGIPGTTDMIHALEHWLGEIAVVGHVLEAVVPAVVEALGGILAGALLVLIVTGIQRLRKPKAEA